MNVLITGANRGLGLAFCQHYLGTGDKVWATHRDTLDGLNLLSDTNLHLVHWDVTFPADNNVLSTLPSQIDLLINNAGVYGPGDQSLGTITNEDMMEIYRVNAIAPVSVVQQLKSRLAQGCIIANVSSRMGSTADNSSGGCYGYRASKAALVILSKSMAIDLASAGVKVITLHPGWVKTDMTGKTGEIDAEESVRGMTRIIENIDQYNPAAFVAWDGEILPY